jgi:hypothetical protein
MIRTLIDEALTRDAHRLQSRTTLATQSRAFVLPGVRQREQSKPRRDFRLETLGFLELNSTSVEKTPPKRAEDRGGSVANIRGLRWWVVALISLGTIINYLSRNALSAFSTLSGRLALIVLIGGERHAERFAAA